MRLPPLLLYRVADRASVGTVRFLDFGLGMKEPSFLWSSVRLVAIHSHGDKLSPGGRLGGQVIRAEIPSLFSSRAVGFDLALADETGILHVQISMQVGVSSIRIF